MKKANVERAIQVLREVEVLQSQGASISEACRKIGVSEHSVYRWKRDYGRLQVDQAKRLKEAGVLEVLDDLFVRRGVPEHIRSDNGSEFTARRCGCG